MTANYNLVTKTPDTLKITNRETPYEGITLHSKSTPIDVPIMYDGMEHTINGFDTLRFTVAGHVYTVTGVTATVTATDAGSYKTAISGTPVVKDENNNVVTDQFHVVADTGNVVISKRPITITVASEYATKPYDGTPLVVTADHITIGGTYGLAARDALTAGTITTESADVNTYLCTAGSFMAGEGVANQSGFAITHSGGTQSSIANYTPSFNVSLSITPADLTITVNDTKMYNQSALVTNYNSAAVTTTGLATNDTLSAGVVTTPSANVGTYTDNTGANITTAFATTKGISNYNVSYNFTQKITRSNLMTVTCPDAAACTKMKYPDCGYRPYYRLQFCNARREYDTQL